MFPECKISEEEVQTFWRRTNRSKVISALHCPKPSFSDFLSLISPAAAEFIPEMRERAATVKRMHFGKTVRIYSPLYVSNYCINDCVYCGFRRSNPFQRRSLTFDEIIRETDVIRDYGIESLLLVSGEDPKGAPVEFLEKVVRELKKKFAYISIEIYPMGESDYRKLFNAGVHGLTIYQETYNRDLYAKLHPSGPKRNYQRRLDAMNAGARAGFYNLGLGALLGLYDWRLETVSLAAHGLWLKKHFWKSRLQFSFPRITPIEGGFHVPCPVDETELEQMMLAFRIFFQEADLYISTRESAEFRYRAALNCASHISAASKVTPGGYACNKDDLGQFTVNDQNSVAGVKETLENAGLEVIFKDWDACFGASLAKGA